MYFDALTSIFSENQNQDNVIPMAAYMKNQFPYLGIKTPERRQLLKEFYLLSNVLEEKELPEEYLRKVWNLPEREYQYAVLDHLANRPDWLSAKTVPFLEELITTKSWWDTVDAIAGNLVGELFSRETDLIHEYLPKWKQHDNLWLRRTAILYQLKYKERTNEDLLFHVIRLNTADTDFFIRKAIGWALREYSKTNPTAVEEFISCEKTKLSSLSVREGMKHIERERKRKHQDTI